MPNIFWYFLMCVGLFYFSYKDYWRALWNYFKQKCGR